jgi:GNAT superfamily N-acetyltransferase
VIIRDRSPDDGPALETLALETHHHDGYPKYLPGDLRSFIVDPSALGGWVAESSGHIVGHVALHRRAAPEVMQAARAATGLDDEDIVMIARLLVAPAARRRGTGRMLLHWATDEAVRLRRRAVLDVVDEHRAAIALYERCGWRQVARVVWALPDGRPLHEFVYVAPELPV